MKNRGFGLIELIFTVSLLFFLGTFATVLYARFLTQNTSINAQDQIIGQLRKAQTYAIMGRQNGGWGVKITASTITLFQGNNFATRNSALDEIFNINSAVTLTGLGEIDFARITGLPSATGTISISDNSTTKNITINSQGVSSR